MYETWYLLIMMIATIFKYITQLSISDNLVTCTSPARTSVPYRRTSVTVPSPAVRQQVQLPDVGAERLGEDLPAAHHRHSPPQRLARRPTLLPVSSPTSPPSFTAPHCNEYLSSTRQDVCNYVSVCVCVKVLHISCLPSI